MDNYLYIDEFHRNEKHPEFHTEGFEISDISSLSTCFHKCVKAQASFVGTGEKVVFHVRGSDYGKLYFEARLQSDDFKKDKNNQYFCDPNLFEYQYTDNNDEGGKIRLLNISLAERFKRFRKLAEKHNWRLEEFKIALQCGNDELFEKARKGLSNGFSESCFNITFVNDCASEVDFKLYVSKPEDGIQKKDAAKNLSDGATSKIVFCIQESQDGKPVNILNKDYKAGGYIWTTSTFDVLRAYIESEWSVPQFLAMHEKFGREKWSELDDGDKLEWLVLSQSRPFAYAVLPKLGYVENPCSIKLGYFGIKDKDVLPVLNLEGEEFCGEGEYDWTPHEVKSYKADWKQQGQENKSRQGDFRCIFISDGTIFENDLAIDVQNHDLTTDVEIELKDGCRIPTGARCEIEVRAINEHSDVLPKDANEWEYELSVERDFDRDEKATYLTDNKGVVNVEGVVECGKIESGILFCPKVAGGWCIHIFWAENQYVNRPKREIYIDVLNRAEKMMVELQPLPRKGHSQYEFRYSSKSKKHSADCFAGDGFVLQAWLEGKQPDEWIYNRHVTVEGMKGITPWAGKHIVHRKGFNVKKSTKVAFKIVSADAGERNNPNLVHMVELNYRVDNSNVTLAWMCVCIMFSLLSAKCSFGINWFNFILYVSPMCVAAVHFQKQYPQYRKAMLTLAAIGIFLFFCAIRQEML